VTRPKALLFDVFGTVVDWRGSIAAALRPWLAEAGIDRDAAALADAWRARYDPAMAPIRAGTRPYVPLDVLHRENLEAVIAAEGLPDPGAERLQALTRAWHRLEPWPDSVPGLARLKRGAILAPLSNGNLALMVNLARHAGLPWDAVLGADWARDYKPSPRVYLAAAEALDLAPGDCMMVAAHNDDLAAAQALGLRTAFVLRPQEHGPAQRSDLAPSGDWDHCARSMEDLAAQLGL
jgi:2-haloacid dehalogenase